MTVGTTTKSIEDLFLGVYRSALERGRVTVVDSLTNKKLLGKSLHDTRSQRSGGGTESS
jgi:hypothetical protein